jgi:DNA-binding GntR family transcriptional regulator
VQSGKRAVLSQSIALQLEAAIIAGQIAAGTRLDENTLADQFAVSRTPVREALQILTARSLATRHPYRGTVVTQITRQRINELFEAMGEVEALCGRFAAERMGMDERARLETLHEEMGTLVEARDLASYEGANTEFHQMIYLGARNSEFHALAEAMRLKLAPFRRRQLDDQVRMGRSHTEHGQIVDAVLQRNGAAAERALRRHLTSAAKAMLTHWREGDTASPAPTTASEPRSGQGTGRRSA